MNESIKKAIEANYRGNVFDKQNIGRSLPSLVKKQTTFTNDADILEEIKEAAKYVSKLRSEFEAQKKSNVDLLGSGKYDNYQPGAIKIVRDVLSNNRTYDKAGNLQIPAGTELGDDKANYLGKIYAQIQDDIKIKKQKTLYDKRKDSMTKGETIARSVFPDAYDREGIVGKGSQGFVDLIEAGPRAVVAGKRSLFDDVPVVASLTAPSELRTEEEKTISGVGASPTVITAPVKLGAKMTAKLASKFGTKKVASWLASKTPEITAKISNFLESIEESTKGVRDLYKKGADAIDTPYSLQTLEDIERAAVNAKTSFGNKLGTNLVREGAKESAVTGAYTASELSKDDADMVTAGLHLLGGSFATALPAIQKSFGTGYGRLAEKVAGEVKAEDMPLGFSEEYFNKLLVDAKKGDVPLTAESVAEMFETKVIPALKASKDADWDLADFILVTASDSPKGSSPAQIMDAVEARIRAAKSKATEEGGASERLDDVLQKFHETIKTSKEGVRRDIEASSLKDRPQTPKLKKSYDEMADLKKKKYDEFGDELDVTEISNEKEPVGFGNFYEAESKDFGLPTGESKYRITKNVEEDVPGLPKGRDVEPSNYVEAEGYMVSKEPTLDEYAGQHGVDLDMIKRERRFNKEGLGGEKSLTTPILPHVKERQKTIAKKGWDNRGIRDAELGKSELSEEGYKLLGREMGKGIENEIQKELGDEALKLYKATHEGYSAMKDLNLENLINEKGRFDRKKFSQVFNQLGLELSDGGKVNVVSDAYKQFGKDSKNVIKVLKDNNLPTGSYEEARKLSNHAIKQINNLNKELTNATDAIKKQKILMKMHKMAKFNEKLTSNVYRDIVKLATKPIENGMGVLKNIALSTAKNVLRESPKGDMTSSLSQMSDADKTSNPVVNRAKGKSKKPKSDYNSKMVSALNRISKMKGDISKEFDISDIDADSLKSLKTLLKNKFKGALDITFGDDKILIEKR